MNEVSIIISIISCVIALGSLAFTLYKFTLYDKKNASLDAQIKENQVRTLKEEEELSKRAQVCANPYSSKNGIIKVKFFNKGKAVAKNINLKEYNAEICDVLNVDTLFPYPLLNPQESFEVLFAYIGDEKVSQITISWEDISGEHEHVQALQLF